MRTCRPDFVAVKIQTRGGRIRKDVYKFKIFEWATNPDQWFSEKNQILWCTNHVNLRFGPGNYSQPFFVLFIYLRFNCWAIISSNNFQQIVLLKFLFRVFCPSYCSINRLFPLILSLNAKSLSFFIFFPDEFRLLYRRRSTKYDESVLFDHPRHYYLW